MIDKFIVMQKENSKYLVESKEYNKKLFYRFRNSYNSERIFDKVISKSDLTKINDKENSN